MGREAGTPRERVFRRRHRLSRSRDYTAVFDARVSARRGPITVFGRPNGLGNSRLGLSVGRRVGNSVVRHAIKRRLREAFRLMGVELEDGYDFVVTVRPHRVLGAGEYQAMFESAVGQLVKQWGRRRRRAESGS